MNNGIIYLIQPTELIGTNRYKIGCSKNTQLDRIKNGYRKGTRYILIMECNKPFVLEKQILKIFNSKFKLIAGKEFFEGDEKEIKNEIINIITNTNNENINQDINQDINENIYNENNYSNTIIINDCILIKINRHHEYEFQYHYESISNLFSNICDFYKCHIQTKDKQILELNDKVNKLFDNNILDIINNLTKTNDNENNINKIINYIKYYKNIIIDIINFNNYDEKLSICKFLGKYDNNYSFLTSMYIYKYIDIIYKEMNYELIKEQNNKYSGVIIQNGLISFVSNVDIDYNYINKKYNNFYDDPREYINDNEYIPETFEGNLENIYFDNNISNYSFFQYGTAKFKEILYPLIIKYSLNDKFTNEMLILIKRQQYYLNFFVKFSINDLCKIKSHKLKYKNLIKYIEIK